MGQLGRNGSQVNGYLGAVILLSSFIFLFLSVPPTAGALSIDPLIDTAVSLTQLNGSQENKDSNRGSVKSEDKTPAGAPLSNKAPDFIVSPPADGSATSESVFVAEPLNQLPSIDASEAQPQTLYMYRPVSTLSASPVVLGGGMTDSAAPLQVSSHGWKVFGAAWYWWVIGSGIMYYLSRRIVRIKLQS